MNALRKITLFFIGLLLFITLPLHTFVWTTRQTLLNRNTVTAWLKEGKVYDNIADAAATLAEQSLAGKNKDNNQDQQPENQENKDDGNMPDAATLIKAAKTAFPPNVLEQDVEKIINGLYDWLEGKTNTIVVNIDLSEQKKVFINALGNEAIIRAASLPACTAPLDNDFDPLSSACIPSGTNVAAQADKIKNNLSGDQKFFADTTISSADLQVGSDGNKKAFWEAYSYFPKAYKQAQSSAYVMTAIVAVLAFLVFLLGKTRKGGLKINAWLFGLAGAWALVLGIVFKVGSSSIVNIALKNNDKVNIGNVGAITLIGQITSTLFKWHMVIGGAYMGVMVICIVAIILMKKKPASGPPKAPEAPAKPLEASPAAQTTEKPKTSPSAPKAQTSKTTKKQNLVQ